MLYKGMPVAALGSVNYIAARNYLKSRGWRQLGNGARTVLLRAPANEDAEVLLPLAKTFSDYAMRIGDLILSVSEIETRSPQELLTDLLLPPSDVLRFSVDTADTSGGTVQFDHGMELYEGVRKAMLSSARAAQHPARYFERLKDADAFVSQCRLGQTELGSFTATFVCPVEALPETDAAPDLFAGVADLFAGVPARREPFARQVTRTLMQAVALIAEAVTNDTIEQLVAEENTGPVNANICEALLKMEPLADGQLRVSSSWARVILPPDGVPDRVEIPKEYFRPIAEIAIALRPPQEPRTSEFVGRVVQLAGQEEDGVLSGPVWLQILTPDNESIRAKVDLNHQDYMTAYDAHGQIAAVSIRGKLKIGARSAEIVEYRDFRRGV
jgi:hypothetical protein